jgi:threonine/homoserine/homoserine lactone efflux protein
MLAACLVGLVVGFAASVPTAGPLTLLIIANVFRKKRYRSFQLAVGGAFAESLYAMAAFLGFGALAQTWMQRYGAASHIAGALALVGVGAFFYFTGRKRHLFPTEAETEAADARLLSPVPTDGSPASRTLLRDGSVYFLGFALIIVNPAIAITWAAVAAATSAWVPVNTIASALGLGIGAFSGISGWFLVLIGLLDKHHARVNPRHIGVGMRVMGVTLVTVGIVLAIGMSFGGCAPAKVLSSITIP